MIERNLLKLSDVVDGSDCSPMPGEHDHHDSIDKIDGISQSEFDEFVLSRTSPTG